MCLGIPGKVIEIFSPQGEGLPEGIPIRQGIVDFAGVRKEVCLSCVEDVATGDYVIVHAGFAISRIDAEEAGKVFQLLREMGALETDAGGNAANPGGAPGAGGSA